MKIAELNPSDYGLQDNKAKQIQDQFQPMLDKMVKLEKTFNEILEEEINGDTCVRAKFLRTEYRKVRKGTEAIHKEQKQFYLQAGRYVDGWKNAQLFAGQGKEEKLKEIEQHFENLEKKRIVELQESRSLELNKFLTPEAIIPDTLGEMHEDVWKNYLAGSKENFRLRIEAEAQAKAERIAKEKAEAEARAKEQARQKEIEEENAKLKKEAEEKEKERIKLQAIADKKLEEAQRATEIAEAKARAIKSAQDKKEALEAETKAKAEEAEAKKGDSAKVIDLISDIRGIKGKYQFKSKGNKSMAEDVDGLLEKIAKHIENK